jgi:uncharacterized protein (UPF0333 family)
MGLLVAASIVAYFLGEKIDTLVILAIVLLSVMLLSLFIQSKEDNTRKCIKDTEMKISMKIYWQYENRFSNKKLAILWVC